MMCGMAHPVPTLRRALVGPALLACVALTGCGSGEVQVSATTGAAAATAPAQGTQLPVEEFASALRRPGTTILDVRTPQEFAQGHLPGAVNIDVSSPDFRERIGQLDPTAPYAVYCRSGNRSAAAVAQMTEAGFTGAYDLAGGIVDWQQAGGEVVTD
jgi:phage shock protein E